MERILDGLVAGNVLYGNCIDHFLSWWPHKDKDNILFLKYEDMKRDSHGAVSQIASFIDADLSDGPVFWTRSHA